MCYLGLFLHPCCSHKQRESCNLQSCRWRKKEGNGSEKKAVFSHTWVHFVLITFFVLSRRKWSWWYVCSCKIYNKSWCDKVTIQIFTLILRKRAINRVHLLIDWTTTVEEDLLFKWNHILSMCFSNFFRVFSNSLMSLGLFYTICS